MMRGIRPYIMIISQTKRYTLFIGRKYRKPIFDEFLNSPVRAVIRDFEDKVNWHDWQHYNTEQAALQAAKDIKKICGHWLHFDEIKIRDNETGWVSHYSIIG
jgi:hypothetical protein